MRRGGIAAFADAARRSLVAPARSAGHARALANLRFAQVDASDIGALVQLSKQAASEARAALGPPTEGPSSAPPAGFSVILIDISGSARFSALLDLIDRYETTFRDSLRLLVIKSFRFACLLDRARLFDAECLHRPPPPPSETATLAAATHLLNCFKQVSYRLHSDDVQVEEEGLMMGIASGKRKQGEDQPPQGERCRSSHGSA